MTYEEFNRAEELPPSVDRMIEDLAPEPAAQRKVKVQIGGYLEAEGSGGQVSRQFHTETLDLLIPDGGFFGWGEREAIDAQIDSLRPGFIALDHWAA